MGMQTLIDPHSGLLCKPPLPRSTGERKVASPQALAPFLSPRNRGRGVERSETEWGSILPRVEEIAR